MSSSSTHLLDSDLVNEWSELLHHEQELIVSSLQNPIPHHHQSHQLSHGPILENGCYLMRQPSKKSPPPTATTVAASPPPPPSNTTSWIELKSSTKCKAPPIPHEAGGLERPKETPLHKSNRPAPAIPSNVRRKIEEDGPVTKQPPPRSGSVSRGLQVEEEDLIQFSDPDAKGLGSDEVRISSGCSRSQGSGRRRNLGRNPENQTREPNNSNAMPSTDKKMNGDNSKLPHEDGEDLDDDDAVSNRTADEQMDYLESLEPCPCYAKCCLDSIITLFCVTLLG